MSLRILVGCKRVIDYAVKVVYIYNCIFPFSFILYPIFFSNQTYFLIIKKKWDLKSRSRPIEIVILEIFYQKVER